MTALPNGNDQPGKQRGSVLDEKVELISMIKQTEAEIELDERIRQHLANRSSQLREILVKQSENLRNLLQDRNTLAQSPKRMDENQNQRAAQLRSFAEDQKLIEKFHSSGKSQPSTRYFYSIAKINSGPSDILGSYNRIIEDYSSNICSAEGFVEELLKSSNEVEAQMSILRVRKDEALSKLSKSREIEAEIQKTENEVEELKKQTAELPSLRESVVSLQSSIKSANINPSSATLGQSADNAKKESEKFQGEGTIMSLRTEIDQLNRKIYEQKAKMKGFALEIEASSKRILDLYDAHELRCSHFAYPSNIQRNSDR